MQRGEQKKGKSGKCGGFSPRVSLQIDGGEERRGPGQGAPLRCAALDGQRKGAKKVKEAEGLNLSEVKRAS